MADPRIVLDSGDIARALTRISHEILERNKGAADLVLLGLHTRGVPLARRIGERITSVEGVAVAVGELDVTMYRDDLRKQPTRRSHKTEIPPGGIDDKVVVLVDDVLFSGRTIRAALDALADLGRPCRRTPRGAGRPRPPRAADPCRPRRQEPPQRPHRAGQRAAGRGRRDRRGDDRVKHLLSIDDLSADDIAELFETAADMHDVQRREVKKLPALRGRTVINMFFEDSTRTRSSFEIAGKWLSADVINISAKGSSASKGESLRDTVLTVCAMGVDGLVIRHPASGAAHQVSQWVDAVVVNAGDGMHEHPTQALLDAYTLQRRLGAPSRARHVAIVGDLTHSRVFRSNVLCLTKLGAQVTVVAPPTLMPSGVAAWSSDGRLRDVVRPRRGAARAPTR